MSLVGGMTVDHVIYCNRVFPYRPAMLLSITGEFRVGRVCPVSIGTT